MHFDKIIIGSSPVCLLEAIYADSRGIKVCIIDNAADLGGAWKKLNMENAAAKGVEIGCHIIEKDRKVFEFFKNKLNLELLEIDPPPKVIFKNKSIPYNLKNFSLVFSLIKSYFTYKHRIKLFAYFSLVFWKEIIQFNLKYFNFKNGSITLVDKLIKEINQRNISVVLSTNIISVKVNKSSEIIELTTAKGETIKSNKLAITNNSNFDHIDIEGKDRANILQRKKYQFTHLHLLINDREMKNISYWRIFNNEVIHRISDMTHQIKTKEGEHLICIGIFSSFAENKTDDSIRESVISTLKKMNLISNSCQIIKAEMNSYTGFYTDLYELKLIEAETNNLVEVVDTIDLAMSIRKNLVKYNAVAYSTN